MLLWTVLCFGLRVYASAVLKVASTSGEKTQAPSTPSSEQKASEGTPGYIYTNQFPYFLFVLPWANES